jgi:hypothetical protein
MILVWKRNNGGYCRCSGTHYEMIVQFLVFVVLYYLQRISFYLLRI